MPPSGDSLLPFLRKVSEFDILNDASMQEIADSSYERPTEGGNTFFREGEKADYVFVLASGRAKLCKLSLDGQTVNLRTILPGSLFGAVGAIKPNSLYPASAQALEDSMAIAIPTGAFTRLIEENPKLGLNLMRLTTDYIQEMQERFQELATQRVEQRIARVLLRLAAQTGRKQKEGVLIDLSFSRQDLAEMAGTTLFTVSRVLSQWEKQGIIQSGRERITLTNPHGLVIISEE